MKNKMKTDNIFINFIYNKIPFKIINIVPYYINKRKVKRFRKKILTGSPSFSMLWDMANFIKLSEYLYFYRNTTTNYIFSSRKYSNGENGFVINIEDDNTVIVVKLYKNSDKVIIEIKRCTNYITSFEFLSNQWTINPTGMDEILLDNVTQTINNNIIKLFDWCYNKNK